MVSHSSAAAAKPNAAAAPAAAHIIFGMVMVLLSPVGREDIDNGCGCHPRFRPRHASASRWCTRAAPVRALRAALLERDDFSSNRHPALAFWWSIIFSENRYPLFGIML